MFDLKGDDVNTGEMITTTGKEILQSRIAKLERELEELRVSKAEAAEVGGNAWHENAQFEFIEQEERRLMRQLADTKEVLARAKIVEISETGSIIQIGSTVVVEWDDGETATVTIRGAHEANPAAGVISFKSPLGTSLLGASAGDSRTYTVGDRHMTITVRSILRKEA